MSDNHDTSERLSRLETITASISHTLEKIQNKLDTQGKVNWAPIAIGVTVFFTVAGSVSTIYNARISTINTAVEVLAGKTSELEKNAVENRLNTKVNDERLKALERDVEDLQDNSRLIARDKVEDDRR